MVYGVVVIHAAGIGSAPVSYQSSNNAENAFFVRHAIPVARIWDELEVAVARLRELIAASKRQPQPVGPQAAGPDPVELIRRLGELRASGVLTDAEFNRKKAEILAKV